MGIDSTNWMLKKTHLAAEAPFTGSGDIVATTAKIAPGVPFKLTEVLLYIAATPTTSTQNFVVTKVDSVATVYNENIITIDLVANAITNLIVKPDLICKAGDTITAAWTNTNTKNYGLLFKYETV